MKTIVIAVIYSLILLILAHASKADTLPLSSLRDLALEYVDVKPVDSYPGSDRLFEVDSLPGDRLSLHLPFEPNRLVRLVPDGSEVGAGKAIARVSGPALSQWLLEADIVRTRHAEVVERYDRYKTLLEQQALSIDAWQQTAAQYDQLRMALHHVEHTSEWLRLHDGVTADLIAPVSGIVTFTDPSHGENPQAEILSLTPQESLRLTTRVPSALAESASDMRVARCERGIAQLEKRVSQLSTRIWSAAIADCVPPWPGLTVRGTLMHRFTGYRIPRDSVIRSEGRTLLAERQGNELRMHDIDIVAEDDMYYYVRSSAQLAGRPVLTRSVSAVQGLLMGLGQD